MQALPKKPLGTKWLTPRFFFEGRDLYIGLFWDRKQNGLTGQLLFYFVFFGCVALLVRETTLPSIPVIDTRLDPICKVCSQPNSLHPIFVQGEVTCIGAY